MAFERIYNTPRQGLGPSTLKTLTTYGRTHGLSLTAAANEILQTDDLGAAARNKLGAFMDQLDLWRRDGQTRTHVELAEKIFRGIGVHSPLAAGQDRRCPHTPENLKELITAMAEFEDLQQFLEHVSLVLNALEADTQEKVTLMTLHAAKGLEFSAVWLPGWEEGTVPQSAHLR